MFQKIILRHHGLPFAQGKNIYQFHYEKLCLQQLNYFATKVSKQLICNYIINIS